MKIDSITISGFRCFDDEGQTIGLDDLSCFVGPNASGKTAAMIALSRMFGETNAQRQIVPSDFHLSTGEELKSRSPRRLHIECRLVFPELEVPGADLSCIPEVFNQMIVEEADGSPYCRFRLEASWSSDGTPEGDVEQTISWILTSSDDPEVIKDGNCRRVQPGDRGKIRVIYVPATRDPNQQIKVTTTTGFGRLLGALAWGETEENVQTKLTELQEELSGLTGISTINQQVQQCWQNLYDGPVAREVTFEALEKEAVALLKLLVPAFNQEGSGHRMSVGDLSDGLRSLFSLSLSLGIFRVEELLRTKATASGFKTEIGEELPLLTIFTVEEPENHLSPHYLGKIVAELNTISKEEKAQVVISSHSPSILGRVTPDNVRYFLGHENSHATTVKPIPLPSDVTDESFKYVREAVRGFPELYFSRLVILGEGASEEIVLRRLFEASGTPIDTHFISIVPLGGRHVNHFWRLLHGLGIPFITLLDLDREKEGAGWGRVQYVRDQLVKLYTFDAQKLVITKTDGTSVDLAEAQFDNIKDKDNQDVLKMDKAIKFFRKNFSVFFSVPLDLDFAMLESFPDGYKGLAPENGGPRLPPSTSSKYKDALKQRMRQVLASDATTAPATLGDSYTSEEVERFAWYKYLFVDGSKPVMHMRALLEIDNEDLADEAPEVLQQLVKRARKILEAVEGAE